jgi:hypothetical protein
MSARNKNSNIIFNKIDKSKSQSKLKTNQKEDKS